MANETREKTVSVAARRSDPKHYGIPKYNNKAPWNYEGGMAPNGVSAYRWLRRTSPDVTRLTPLAAWLFDHCPPSVAGRMPSKHKITCYNGKTEADVLRAEARESTPFGYLVCGSYYHDPEKANKVAESFIRIYDMEHQQSRIEDYLFPIITPGQSDEDYWNHVADLMLKEGVNRVVIGNAEWTAREEKGPGASASEGEHDPHDDAMKNDGYTLEEPEPESERDQFER